MIVTGWQQALTLVAVLVPGFVFQVVQHSRVGPSPEDRELTVRLVRALAYSIGFLLLYLMVLGSALSDRLLHPQDDLGDPRIVGSVGAILVFIVPAVAGHLVASFQTRQSYNQTTFWGTLTARVPDDGKAMTWKRAIFSRTSNYNPIPTAWDFATAKVDEGSFVRILNADGLWIGGRVGMGAYFTSYPEPRDVYIDQAWVLDETGEFKEPFPEPTGMWVPCTEAQLVQFIDVPADDGIMEP